MRMSKKCFLLLLGVFLLLLFTISCTERDNWQDHILDPGLGGEIVTAEPYWGYWVIIEWRLETPDGEILEAEEADWFEAWTYNSDGTCVFSDEESDYEGTYEITDGAIIHDVPHDHWGNEDGFGFEVDKSVDPPVIILSIEGEEEVEVWTFEKTEEE